MLVAGESRYLAAVDAGVAEVPCLIDNVDGETGGLDDALVENLLREDLSPMDEARAFRRLREGGLSARAIAQRVGRSATFVRERLALLDLPEALHRRIDDGTVPLSAVPALLALGKIHPKLPEVGVRSVLDGPVRTWEEPTTWDDLAADPVWFVVGSVPEQYEDLPEGVYVGRASYPVTQFALEERAAKALDKIVKLLGVQLDSLQVRFDRDAVEQAAALSAAFPSKDGYRTLIVGTDVASQLVGDALIARLRAERARAKRERDARRPTASSNGGASAAGQPAAEVAESDGPSEDERRERQRREREEAKEAARRAHAYNVLLGAQLTKHLWRVKLDDRVLKVLAAAPLASDFREIATRGARIAFPGWPTETTRRNGTVKVTYLETYDAARKAGEYLAGASKAGEVAGRSLALLAAARWADEEALPMSRRSLYTLGFARTFGVPWADEAAELLDDLLIAPVPPSRAKLRAWREAGADPAERPRTFFRLTAVFDRAQVDPLSDFPGEPAVLDPPIVPVDGDHLGHLLEPLRELASEIGSEVCVEAIRGSANGYYELDSRRIVVAPVADDFSVNAQVRTLVHELSHALVRADRREDDPELDYAEEEVVVETVAHCVCASIGFDVSGYSFAYIATWADSAGGTATIERYAALIDRLARRLEDVVVTAVERDEANGRQVSR